MTARTPQSDDLVATGADMQQSYGVGEEIGALYGRADFREPSSAASRVEGNFGVRWVSTDTQVKGTG
jgi:iron complex outermembrane receptor protein